MTVFDDVCGKALSSVLGNSASPLAASVLQMINNQPGGLSGLLQNFHEKGLGDLVNSWVGTGQNLPVSAEQIQQALGNDKLQQIAQQSGISAESISSHLSSLLPVLVDKLTPNGQMPQGGNLLDMCSNILDSFNKTTAA
jgi:uncharacterized protein YidB (DUF937 family)